MHYLKLDKYFLQMSMHCRCKCEKERYHLPRRLCRIRDKVVIAILSVFMMSCPRSTELTRRQVLGSSRRLRQRDPLRMKAIIPESHQGRINHTLRVLTLDEDPVPSSCWDKACVYIEEIKWDLDWKEQVHCTYLFWSTGTLVSALGQFSRWLGICWCGSWVRGLCCPRSRVGAPIDFAYHVASMPCHERRKRSSFSTGPTA